MLTRVRKFFVLAGCGVIVAAGMLTGAGQAAAAAPGYALEGHHLIGTSPYGYRVFTDPQSPRAGLLARRAAGISRELRRLGVRIAYRGWSAPRPDVTRRIFVTTGVRGCLSAAEGATLAVTYFSLTTLDNGHEYIPGATIYMCPVWLRHASTRLIDAALHHEFGHAMGLAHYPGRYRGRYQIMHSGLLGDRHDFGAGDRAGLRRLARGATELGRESVGHGKLQTLSWAWDQTVADWKLTVDGWGLVNSFFQHPSMTVTVRRDGKVIDQGPPTVYRPAVNRRWHVHGRHGFRIGAGYALTGTHNYCVSISPRPRSRFALTIGCTSLTY